MFNILKVFGLEWRIRYFMHFNYLIYYLLNLWSSKQSFAALVSGKSIQARVFDLSQKMEDPSFSFPRELEVLA